MDFPFKTVPFDHQAQEFERSGAAPIRGLLFEQGCGKTKVVLDTAAQLYALEEIDALLVIAPNGVHGNWIHDEIPVHLHDDVPRQVLEWETKRAKSKAYQRKLEGLITFPGLAVLAVNYDVFARKGVAFEFAERFLRERKAMFVCDESQRIKTPGAKRTQKICRLGRKFSRGVPEPEERIPYRRILSGTPITNAPLDVYSQLKFLDWDLWRREGFASYESFRTYFGVFVKMVRTRDGEFKRQEDCSPQEVQTASGRFERVVGYRNLEELKAIVDRYCTRVTKDEVLDLPPKVYTKRYFEMTASQRKLYDTLREEFMVWLNGDLVTAPLALTRLLRLQQVTCGYVPGDDCETMHYLPDNPRLSALLDTLEDVDGKAIIFARFRQDITSICAELGDLAVRYDGDVSDADRLKARRRFQDPDDPVRFFVANPAAAATGLTLTAAKTVIYYSNSFKLEDRLQSEDRAHRIGQTSSVRYIDLVAENTVDAKIVRALREKRGLAEVVLGDEIKSWI